MSFDAIRTTFTSLTFVATGALGTLYKNTRPVKAPSTRTRWENTLEFLPVPFSYTLAFS